jgi:hypothetical protein
MFGKGKMKPSANSKFIMERGRAVGNLKAPATKIAKPQAPKGAGKKGC